MEILPISSEDLDEVSALRPDGWGDIRPAHQLYVENDFCAPFKFVEGGRIVGIGTAIFNNTTAWLAHIIVHPERRKKGLGLFITDHLVKFAEGKGCRTISLIATELGKPVYEKLGFETEALYSFFKGPCLESRNNFNIRPFVRSRHLEALLQLDLEITGEDRRCMITARLHGAVVYLTDKIITGYYLPQLGEGPVYAKTFEAGMELVKCKCTRDENILAVPDANIRAIDFFKESGYEKISTCTRMARGKAFSWKPMCYYARVGGFYG